MRRLSDPPYLGPPRRLSAGNNRPIRRVVIHMTVSPCVPGQARATAAYFRSASAGGSAHYCIDPDEEVQSAYDGAIAWHAPPNPGSIGIELCGYPTSNPVAARALWRQRNYARTLDRAAWRTAQILVDEDLPAKFLTPAQLRAGERGVTTHANVSEAFGQSSHWDPGVWPRARFMRKVRKYVKILEKGSAR